MAGTVDNLIAARIIYLLVLPFPKWEAYKEGIIDEDGNRTEQDAGDSPNWTMLHRLVCRLKKLLGTVPGGKSVIGSVTAAYLLVRECVERDTEQVDIESLFEEALKIEEPMTLETYNFVNETLAEVSEELGAAPTNVTGGVAGVKAGDEPPVDLKRRKKKKNDPTSAIVP